MLYCGYTDAKDAKPMLEEFKKDYSSITEACKAVGFVRDTCSTRGLSLLLKFFFKMMLYQEIYIEYMYIKISVI